MAQGLRSAMAGTSMGFRKLSHPQEGVVARSDGFLGVLLTTAPLLAQILRLKSLVDDFSDLSLLRPEPPSLRSPTCV